ncbi:Lpg1974 family pore-forming outer membrane protein [Urbifossiella limnaea]|uniref:Outer membrane beta-barrel protein n=1 Tax=Urbifossiella limnaea TaxID=2528023 RepID=A0A517XUB3_9BACT|nr:Lpg1974 family pore-forming outer membrane protein [Urbifossiella limnaea]QDU21074.1 hypothetical protein ETAA1_30390 [Urbifossiella limnaea]
MRQWFIKGAVLAAALGGTGRAYAQDGPPDSPLDFLESTYTARGQAPANVGFDAGLNTEPTLPIPTGAAGSPGFYASAEYVMLTQTRTLGDQVVAYRGLIDSTGLLSGNAGTYIGQGVEALNTNQLGRTTYTPGFQVELGYRFEDGTRLYGNYMQLFDAHYSASASLVAEGFQAGPNLVNSFLVSPVYNFNPQYSGPASKLVQDLPGVGSRTVTQFVITGATVTVTQPPPLSNAPPIITTTPTVGTIQVSVPANQIIVTRPTQIGNVTAVNGNTGALLSSTPVIVNQPQGVAGGNPGFNAYGIWNGASVMDMKFTQRYQQAEIGARIPVFQTDYSRVYGIAGVKFGWFFERFNWRTVSYDINGVAREVDQAFYTNTLSQRLYGPMVGAGHEIFVSNQFSLSCDLTAAMLLGVIKERTTYELGDKSNRAKRSNNEWALVPNANANLNLWWYPVEGVQVRVGYNALTYFNTQRMEEPVSFNVGAIDPKYDTQWFRLLHGVNVGVGLFF